MPQSLISKSNAVRSRWTGLAVAALTLGAFAVSEAGAMRLNSTALVQEAAGVQAQKAQARGAPAKKAQAPKQKPRPAGKKGKATAEAERLASVLDQISAALKNGRLTPVEALYRIEEIKKGWIAAQKEAVAAKANAPGGPAKAGKAIQASASRASTETAKTADAAQSRLPELVANFNAAERNLNKKVADGLMSRTAANRYLRELRDELALASGAAAAKRDPKEAPRYQTRQQELLKARARGFKTDREVNRELRELRETIAREFEEEAAAALRAQARRAKAQKDAAKKPAPGGGRPKQ